MEVLVGRTLGIDVSSSPTCVRDCTGGAAQDKHGLTRFSPFTKDTGERGNPEFEERIASETVGRSFGFRSKRSGKSEAESSSESSSSIGEPDESEDNDDVSGNGESEEVQSKFNGGLGSLGSLEESLPIKRGLSNYFIGKSKSFGNLGEVSRVKDLEKEENPLNKRRRTLMASKWTRKKSSFYTWSNPTSMPLLALSEDQQQEEEEIQEQEEEEKQEEKAKAPSRKFKSFKSSRCFSLTDLQEQHDDDDDAAAA